MFGNEALLSIDPLVGQVISSLDIIPKEPLNSAHSFLEEAISSVTMEAYSDAFEHFCEARAMSVKAFSLAKRTNDIGALCLSSRFWILCDINIASYNISSKRFVCFDQFDAQQNRISYGKVKVRTEKLMEVIDELELSSGQQKARCDFLSHIWPFLVQFSPKHNIPSFSPK